jgi:gas vesicle protein
MNAGKLVVSVVTGVAVGAILGVLFAPDKGSSTRSKISKKSGDLTDDLERKFNKFVDKFSKKFEKLQDEADYMAEEIKSKAEETTAKFSSNKV